MIINSRALAILIILLMAGGLVACGRKGSLELPPQSAVTLPGAPVIS